VNISREAKITTGFVVAVLFVFFAGAMSWSSARRSDGTFRWVSHTHEVLTKLKEVEADILGVQSAVRGFALTGLDRFLEVEERARTEIHRDLEDLRQLIADNPAQVRRLGQLEPLMRQALEVHHNHVDTRRVRGLAAVTAEVATGEGKRAADAVLQSVRKMEAAERLLGVERAATAQSAARATLVLLFCGSLATIVIVVAAGVIAHRGSTTRQRAEEALRRSTLLLEASQAIAQTGGWEMDLGTKKLFWTAETYRLHDTTPEEFNPTVDAGIGFYLPESRRIIADALQAAMARGEGYDLVLETLTTKGHRIDVRTTCAVTLHEGRPAKLTGIFQDITARTTAEAAQARLAAIVASSDDAIISEDLDGIITTWNHGAEKLFGYAAAEIIGQSVTRLFPPEKRAEGLEILAQIIAGKPMIQYETVRLAKDGRPIEVSMTISPIHGSTGRIIGSAKILRDITVRKRAAEQLAAARRELEDVKVAFDEHALVAITDAQGKINFINDKFCAISQYARAELLGQDHRIINSGYHPKEFIRELWTTIGRGQVWKGELKNRAKDGSFYWVDTTIVPFLKSDGTPYQYVAIRTDVTARKQAEAALRESEERLRTMFTQAPTGIALINSLTGQIQEVNPKFAQIAGRTKEEMLRIDWMQITHPDDVQEDLDNMARLNAGKITGFQMNKRYVRPDGSVVWISMTIAPNPGADKAHSHHLCMIEDITARKAAENEILQLNAELEQRVRDRTAELQAANQELEAFSYSVSHDLRAPLRHLTGFAQLLIKNDRAKLDDTARRHLTFISESAVQMGRLIDDLLAFSRSGRTELRKEPVNLDALVQEVIRGLHPETQGWRTVWQIAPLPVVNADAALLRAVLTNLFANAVKFTRSREEPTIQMGCTENERERVFFIRDNGVGFDMQYVDKLFGVFQRLHATEEFEGTGIGLANVRRIITRHGGRTWAESVLNEGATFYFSLPNQ